MEGFNWDSDFDWTGHFLLFKLVTNAQSLYFISHSVAYSANQFKCNEKHK